MAGLSQVQLANISGMSIQSIKKYESGAVDNITIKNMNKIANALQMPVSFFVSEDNRSLSPSHPSVSEKISPISLKPKDDMINIPMLYHINASARSGVINEIPKDVEYREFTKESLRESFKVTGGYQDLFIMRSFGNSMFPTIPQNALLLVQKGNPLEGQICVARIGKEMFVKRIAKLPKIRLLSDNKEYEAIPITKEMDFEIIGRVVGYFGSL